MFDTAELLIIADMAMQESIFTHGYRCLKDKKNEKKRIFDIPSLKAMGISIYYEHFQKVKDGIYYYVIRARLDLATLASYGQSNNCADLATEEDLEHIQDCFTIAIQSYFPELPCDIGDWFLNRLDCTINLHMLDFGNVPKNKPFTSIPQAIKHTSIFIPQENRRYYLPQVYCDLLNRGKPVGRTELKNEDEGSYYYGNKKSYTINFYDKVDEVDKHWKKYGDGIDNIIQTRNVAGILRIEVQLRKAALQTIRYKMNKEDRPRRNLIEMLRNNIAFDRVEHILQDISTSVPYRSREDTVDRVRHTHHRADIKAEMIELIDRINMANDYGHLQEIWDNKRHKKLRYMLLQDGINPVVLRQSEMQLLGVAELEPLIDVFNRELIFSNSIRG